MKKVNYLLFVTIFVFALGACKKKGCLDQNATNYNSEAKKDDGSCLYEGSAVIWFNTPKVIEYSATGTSNLVFYLEGIQIGTLNLLDFINTAPACGGDHAVTVKRNLDSAPSKSFSLVVKGDSGATLDTYSLTIVGNKCTKFLLN